MASDVEAVSARQKQSAASKKSTLDLMKGKSRSRHTFTLFITNGTGEQQEAKITFQAMGSRDYDKLVGKHPPKADQRLEGASFDIDTFAPALISACSLEPEMSLEDAQEIWQSDSWSRGDLMVLFRNAVELNNRGLDIPFNENG